MKNNNSKIQDASNEASWIDVSGLHKIYNTRGGGQTHALSDINFTAKKGEFISIVGPSGCGKTTLLNILAGLISKTEGSASISGHEVSKPLPEIGMVFQAPTLLPWRTIQENVMVPVEVQKLDKKKHLEKAKELLKLAGLEGFEDKYPNELSGGMQQRAGICRALVHSPSVL
jgi:NitT/TauT family transport system ATP-binding protein